MPSPLTRLAYTRIPIDIVGVHLFSSSLCLYHSLDILGPVVQPGQKYVLISMIKNMVQSMAQLEYN